MAAAPEQSSAGEDERLRKFELIDRFIQQNPKIVPRRDEPAAEIDLSNSLKIDRKELMTETLARVYLEQGKYKKAIQAYRVLSLKYPEKSGFFADQIKAVEKLREDNKQ
jgi:Tfp pilus assembly protein PilF